MPWFPCPFPIYGTGVATYLYEQGHPVSIITPLRISGFAQSELPNQMLDSLSAKQYLRLVETTKNLQVEFNPS